MWLLLFWREGAPDRLLLVQTVFRHGARHPIYPNPFENKTEAFVQLAPSGMRQLFVLGKMLRKRYIESGLLPDKYSTDWVSTRSTYFLRTYQSAMSLLMGLFSQGPRLPEGGAKIAVPPWEDPSQIEPLDSQFSIPDGIQPTAILSRYRPSQVNYQGDYLLQYSPTTCPMQNAWLAENKQAQRLAAFNQSQRVREFVGSLWAELKTKKVQTLSNVEKEIDNCFSFKYLGFNYSKACDSRSAQYFMVMVNLLTFFLRTEQLVATASPYFLQTLRHIGEAKAAGQRLYLYSAHDMTVLNYLAALNLTNPQCVQAAYNGQESNSTCVTQFPSFASTLTFELWEGETRYVRVLYQGRQMQLGFCRSSDCTVEQFSSFLKNASSPDFLNLCGVIAPSEVVLMAVLGALALVLVGVGLAVLRHRRQQQDQVQLLPSQQKD